MLCYTFTEIKQLPLKRFLLTNSFIADSGIDLENPSPLHVLVGVLTSFTTTFFCMAGNKNGNKQSESIL